MSSLGSAHCYCYFSRVGVIAFLFVAPPLSLSFLILLPFPLPLYTTIAGALACALPRSCCMNIDGVALASLCLGVCGCVRLRVVACGCVWLRVVACGCVRLRVVACGWGSPFSATFFRFSWQHYPGRGRTSRWCSWLCAGSHRQSSSRRQDATRSSWWWTPWANGP